MPYKDPERQKTNHKNYVQTHREQINTNQRNWRKLNSDKCRKTQRTSTRKCREKLKREIFELLGGCCTNPYGQHKEPYTDIRALQIDHINGGGRKGRHGKSSISIYRDILIQIKSGSKNYQLLCANCNWIKRYKNHEQPYFIGEKKND